MSLWKRNLLLGLLVVVLALLPLALRRGAEWRGADDRSTEAIQQVDSSYQPWFVHLFNPGDLGIERYMFGLQALIGAAFTFGAIGWFVGRRRALTGGDPAADRRAALVVLVLAAVVFVALFFVQTEATELQDLISAIQGVCVGFLAFFAGYLRGRRSVVGRQVA